MTVYDSPWKEALDLYFPAFLLHFYPRALETRHDPESRRTWKFRLVRGLYARGETTAEAV